MSRFRGVGVAIVTPFTKDEGLDEKSFRALVRRQVKEGTDFLVPCGTTGESVTLSADEQRRVVEWTVAEAGGRPVLAGAGSNDTRSAIEKGKAVVAAGAQGILSVAPYYNKPNADGYVRHFTAIADASPVPVMLYNVPGRTGSNMDTRTQVRLASHPNIFGVKEASGNLVQVMEILRDVREGFDVFAGDDYLTLPLMALGAKGVISVISNEAPRQMKDLVDACARGDWARARDINASLIRLMNTNFVESNPIPVKAALALMGLCQETVRSPLAPANAVTREALRACLIELGLVH